MLCVILSDLSEKLITFCSNNDLQLQLFKPNQLNLTMSEFYPSRSPTPEPQTEPNSQSAQEPKPSTPPESPPPESPPPNLPNTLLKIIEGKDHTTRLKLANEYLAELKFEMIFKKTCSIGGSGAICPLTREQRSLLRNVNMYVTQLKNVN